MEAKIIVFLLFALGWKLHFCADDTEFMCSDDLCLNYETENKCPVGDISKCYNETFAVLLPSPTVCSCCETCLLFQKEGESCINGSPGQTLPGKLCGPGLKCVAQKCVKMDLETDDPLREDDNYVCDDDGKCHCVARVSNKLVTIFGNFSKSSKTEGRQCGCSVLANEVLSMTTRALPFKNIYQPFARCLPNGQFDPLQCYEGICSCIDPGTGAYDDTAPRVALSSLGPMSPICFNATVYHHTKEYYRPCEKTLAKLLRTRDLAEAEGFQFMFPFEVKCRPDGECEDEECEEQILQILDAMEKSMSLSAFYSG